MLEKKRNTSRGEREFGGVETPGLGEEEKDGLGIRRPCLLYMYSLYCISRACMDYGWRDYRVGDGMGEEKGPINSRKYVGNQVGNSVVLSSVHFWLWRRRRGIWRCWVWESGRLCVDMDGYEEWRFLGEWKEKGRKRKSSKKKRERKDGKLENDHRWVDNVK
jgi:hypothetical protein